MQTFRFTGSYSINTHNSLKHKAISRFYLQLILYASFCAPYFGIKFVLSSSMLILFIRYKRTLIALLKLYAAAANNTLIAS